jgi:hypothetical protein
VRKALLLGALVLAVAPASAPAFQLRMFHTAGGNVGCAMILGREARGGSARCDIAKHEWQSPPTPKWCDLDYGNGLVVGPRKKAGFVCAGDTVLRQGKALAVGNVVRLGPFRCKALRDQAVTCWNVRSKHGFKLSRTLARIF